jgi:hypothetical protein
MKKQVLLSLGLTSFLSFASDVRDYCTNVDQDVGLFEGNISASYYEGSKAKTFHFETEDYTVKVLKKIVFEESQVEEVKDTHYALSLLVTFNKQVKVPDDSEFTSAVFRAAKEASQTKLHFICRDYSAGSPLPPTQ